MFAFHRSGRPTPERREGTAPNGLPWESVWDYPRPPEIRPEPRQVTVSVDGIEIARSARAVKVCETAGGPVVYIPPDDIADGALSAPRAGGSFCEWKGSASYFDVIAGKEPIPNAAWTYPNPTPTFEPIAGWISFYPALVECRLGDEVVRPQPGRFYGGWMTDEITGPVKGEPGTEGW